MQHPFVLLYENDQRLSLKLGALWEQRRWAKHTVRHPDTCWQLLQQPRPTVLVLKVGRDPLREAMLLKKLHDPQRVAQGMQRDLERKLTLLERVASLLPYVVIVAVGDVADAELESLIWSLGADYVLFPPQPRDWLVDVVAALMDSRTPQPPPALPVLNDEP
ncbi:MAG: hypothetical protein ACK4RK_03320 [Gemmataceae bacterium]